MNTKSRDYTCPLPLCVAFVWVCLRLCGCGSHENAGHDELPMKDGRIDLIKMSESVWDRESKLSYEKLSQPERVFLCIWDLEAEVDNGGFDQYYFNSAGDHALDTVRALETIGAKRTAELVKTMNNLFGP